MRMRLGILHDAAAQDRMYAQAEAEAKRKKEAPPTVLNELEQKKKDDETAKEKEEGKKESKAPKVKIRPLSEAKAIELGANFFSEAFIFAVAAGLLVWDSWRSRRKESARRDDVADRLDGLEAELDRLRHKYEPDHVHEAVVEKPEAKSWWNPARWWERTEPTMSAEEQHAITAPRTNSVSQATVNAIDAGTEKPSPAVPKEKAGKTPVTKIPACTDTAPILEEESRQRVDSIVATKKER